MNDAGAQLFDDQAVDDGVKSGRYNDEQNTEELYEVRVDSREPVTYNYDDGRYLIERVDDEVGGTGLEGLAAHQRRARRALAVRYALFVGISQDSDVGESDDDEDHRAYRPGHAQTWKHKVSRSDFSKE